MSIPQRLLLLLRYRGKGRKMKPAEESFKNLLYFLDY